MYPRTIRLGKFALATLFFASFQATVASEGLDYSLGAGARTLPKGVSLHANLGYGKLLWGANPEGEVSYGYVRPVLNVRTSVLVNAAEAELQVAPISFFILSAGGGVSSRSVDTATVDCSTADCRGTLGSQHLSATLLLGAGKLAGGINTRLAWMRSLTPAASASQFADESSALVGARDGDRLLSHQFFLAWHPLLNWRFGGFSAKQQMSNTGDTNYTHGLFAKLTDGPWDYTGGVNFYESTLQPRTPGLFFAATWTGMPSVGLH